MTQTEEKILSPPRSYRWKRNLLRISMNMTIQAKMRSGFVLNMKRQMRYSICRTTMQRFARLARTVRDTHS